MGLAFHNPSDSTYLSDLTEHRHLPGRRENPRERHPRRPFHWTRDKLSKIDLRYEQEHDTELWRQITANFPDDGLPAEIEDLICEDWIQLRKKHHLSALAFQASRGRRNKYHGPGILAAKVQYRSAPCPSYGNDEKEGRALARSSLRLPGDRARERRPPSLERQEAFRDPSTSRKRSFSGMSELMDEEELYRLGVLYDDEHERGSGFTLGTIVHDGPAFNIRPAKRGRSRKAKTAGTVSAFVPDLPLHLSFSALGEDEALAAFLISPDDNELVPEEKETPTLASPNRGGERRATSQPTLTTIYELEIEHSRDFHSEPNTQTSAHFEHPTACSDFPDLISDSEHDNEMDEDEDEDEDAWALLDSLRDDMSEGADSGSESDSTRHPADHDAWIMLGDDS